MKKHTSSKSDMTSASNSKTELFVLPPELLAQLGINLSEVQSPATNLLRKDSNQNIDLSNPNSLADSRDISSIIETANLMKESVFLSPTFQQNVSNNHDEEPVIVDSVGINSTIPPKTADVLDSRHSETEDILICDEITPELLHDRITVNQGIVVGQTDKLEVFESVKEYQVENQDGNLILTDLPYQKNAVENISKKTLKHMVEEHSDKIYLSDCSNDNSRCAIERISFGGHKRKLVKKTGIFEEMVRSSSQLKDPQNSSNTVVSPVTLNPITTKQLVHNNDSKTVFVTGKKPDITSPNHISDQPQLILVSGNSNTTEDIPKSSLDISSENIISWTPADRREKEMKIAKIDYDVNNKSIIHFSDSTSARKQSKDTTIALVDSDCVDNPHKNNSVKSLQENLEYAPIIRQENLEYPQSKNTVEGNDTNQNNNITSNVIRENNRYEKDMKEKNNSEIKNAYSDQVKEIAAYLSQIANEKKNMNCKKYKLATKNGQMKAELCIQGVEKPGGKLIQKEKKGYVNVLKTYQRRVMKKKRPELIEVPDDIMITDMYQLPNNPETDATVNPSEFCICYDFGNLAYYDCEQLYEHIHFWLHNSIDCDLSILYSMYNEDDIFLKQSVDFIEDYHQNEHNDDGRDNFCWNKLNIRENKYEKFEYISNHKISGEIGPSGDKKHSVDAISKLSLPVAEKVEDKTDKTESVDNKDKINRKRSSNVNDQASEPKAKMKNKCEVENQIIVEKEFKIHEANAHNPIAVTADKLMETNSTCNNTKRNSKNYKKKIPPTLPVQESISKINDSSVTAIGVISARKLADQSSDLSSNPTRASTVEIDCHSKSTLACKNAEIEIRPTISNIKTDLPSQLNQNSTNMEKDVLSCSTRRTTKIEVTAKSIQLSNMLENTSKLTKTLKKTENTIFTKITDSPKIESTQLSPGVKLARTSKPVHETTDTLTISTENIELIKLVNTKDGVLRKKSIESTVAINVAKDSGMNISKRSTKTMDDSENAFAFKSIKSLNRQISNETTRSTRSSELKSDSLNFITKSTEGNELVKYSENVTPRKTSEDNSDSSNTSQKFDINVPTKSVRKLSGIESKPIKDTTNTETPNSTVISSKTKSDFCNPLIKSTEINKWTTFSNTIEYLGSEPIKHANSSKGFNDIDMTTNGSVTTDLERNIGTQICTRKSPKVKNSSSFPKGIVLLTTKSTRSTDSPEASKAVDKNITDAISGKASDQKIKKTLSDFPAIITKDKNDEKLKSSKRKSSNTTLCKNRNMNISPDTANSQTTKPECNILNKTNDSDDLSRSSEECTVAENNDILKSTSNENLHKIDKIMESANSKKTLKKSTNIEICESLKSIKRSSDELKIHTSVKKAKAAEIHGLMIEESANVSDKKQPDSTVCKISNGKSSKINNIKDTEITLNSTECSSQNDTAIVNSTIADKLLIDTDNYIHEVEVTVPPPSIYSMKCGVCEKSIEDSKWIEHISENHDYCAWRMNEPALDLEDEEAVRKHLQVISNQNDGLKCSKCGLIRKFAKPYMRHVKKCTEIQKDEANTSAANDSVMNSTQEEQENDDTPLSRMKSSKSWGQRRSTAIPLPPVTCGVCSKTLEDSAWIEHIRVEHKYLAWRAGENPLNIDDEDEVKSHLKHISKYYGGLICDRCGAKWNYVKKYLVHISLCGSLLNKPSQNIRRKTIKIELSPIVTCGSCKQNVEGENWIKHNQEAHEYLAWIDGEKPLNVDDAEEVKEHLKKIISQAGELVCKKCGSARINARAYLLHVNACTKSGFEMQITESTNLDRDKFECGVCHEQGHMNKWKEHAMKKHYNIAWMVGELPINVRNFYAVAKYLKEYQKKHDLVCKHCRASRTSGYGFYAHILTCGKTDEEIEAVHNICEICNSKYLCVYRNQHLASHRDQEQRREMQKVKAEKAAEEALKFQSQDSQPITKRKAAEKAKKVIEKYNLNGKPICSCGAIFSSADELAQHDCALKKKLEDYELDVSVKKETESGAEYESSDTDFDSTVYDCEEDEDEDEIDLKKKRQRIGEGSSKISRMPYRVTNYNTYLAQSYKDFSNFHLTSKSLFNEWRNSKYKVVPSDEMDAYLPTLTESCKVRFGGLDDSEWITYKRFEARKVRGYSMFAGGVVQCVSWAPPNIEDETLGSYLAVATHRGADVPRHGADETPQHAALLQIWDFKQFNFIPKCGLGLALDYGIVWAMDWCPSGARDLIPSGHGDDAAANFRLGLLAVACSNGTCYILAVPYPPVNTDDKFVMYKLEPVAELRLCMTSERRIYQATSIKWSQQKGHDAIIVGYSDGTTALYDLNTESPFLKTTDNNVTVFYPFQDRKSECSSITGVGVYPTLSECHAAGGWFSTSVTGGTMGACASAAPAVRARTAASGACASAHWPAAIISGDAPFMKSVTELEWWGGGRRLGASRAACACVRCGRTCAAAAPAVRLLRSHPCYPELKKLIIATLLMVPFGQKRKRKVNDDLSMVVEPLTYEDAVEKYGLELTMLSRKDQAAAQQLCNENEFCPHRFPLSDIVSVAFCPSARFHDKLALGTHSGMLFVINA